MWIFVVTAFMAAGAIVFSRNFKSARIHSAARAMLGGILGGIFCMLCMMQIASSLDTSWKYIETIEIKQSTTQWGIPYSMVHTGYDEVYYEFADATTGELHSLSTVDNVTSVLNSYDKSYVDVRKAIYSDAARTWLPSFILDEFSDPRSMRYDFYVPGEHIILDSMLVGP